MTIGNENDSSLVTPLPITTIEDLDEARHLADVVEIVTGQRPKLQSVLNDIWLSRQEAQQDSQNFLNRSV